MTQPPPKNLHLLAHEGGKSREVPLPEVVAVALAEHLRQYPTGEDGLVFTSRERKPMARTYYTPHLEAGPRSGRPRSHWRERDARDPALCR